MVARELGQGRVGFKLADVGVYLFADPIERKTLLMERGKNCQSGVLE